MTAMSAQTQTANRITGVQATGNPNPQKQQQLTK